MAIENDNSTDSMNDGADAVKRYRDYADSDADWFWEIDANFRFTTVSMRREGRSDINERDLLGKTPWEFAEGHLELDSDWASLHDKLMRREPFRGFDVQIRQADGSTIYWKLSGKPVFVAEGRFVGYRGVAMDETVQAIQRKQMGVVVDDYRVAIDVIPEGIAYFDARRRLVQANAALKDMLPVSAETFQRGISFSRVMENIAAKTSGDAAVSSQVTVAPTRRSIDWKFRNGNQVFGEIKTLPSGGHLLHVRNMTSDQKSDAASLPSDLFHDVIEYSLQPFFVHIDGIIIYLNEAAASVFGASAGDILGRQIWDFIHPDDAPRLREFAAARQAGAGAPVHYETKGLTVDGKEVFLDFRVRYGAWDEGSAFQVFLQDRTKELAASNAREKSELRFRNLVDGSIQGYLVHRDWNILYANGAASHIFGYQPAEFIETGVLNLIAPNERDAAIDIAQRRLAGDETVPERFELGGVRKDGTPVTVEIFSRVIEWDDGPAIQSTMVDISRRKEMEAYLVRAKEAAEYADRTKTEFLGNMSHELRTPLNAIIGFSQLIRDQIMGEVSAHYIDYASSIHTSGMHLLAVVNDLLDVAAVESGAMSLNEEEIDMIQSAKTCERMLRPRAQKADILVSIDAKYASLNVKADDRRIKQIMINLLNNAIKFTNPGGQVVLRLFVDDQQCPVIEVEDTGIGISEKNQKTVFDPFFRVDSAFVSEKEGTGLGLPLVHALCELHGAAVSVKSEIDKGTTFTVVLPKNRFISTENKE